MSKTGGETALQKMSFNEFELSDSNIDFGKAADDRRDCGLCEARSNPNWKQKTELSSYDFHASVSAMESWTFSDDFDTILL